MISENCLQEFQSEMSNAENAYEYVYSCFTIFIGIVQLYILIEYCLFRFHYANQYEKNDHIKEKIGRRIAGRIPTAETKRKMNEMEMRIELLESSQDYPPGTQKYYNNFPSRDLMMEKSKESELPERRGGGKGMEILRISEEPVVPTKSSLNNPDE